MIFSLNLCYESVKLADTNRVYEAQIKIGVRHFSRKPGDRFFISESASNP